MTKKPSLTNRVKKLERHARSTTPETRELCSEFSSTNIPNFGILQTLNYFSGGTDNQEARIGDEIRMMKFDFNILIDHPQHATNSAADIRVLIVRSKGGALVVGDMPASVHGCPDYDSYYILYDKIHRVHANAWNGSVWGGFNGARVVLKKTYKAGLLAKYDDAGPVPIANGVYLYLISNVNNVCQFRGVTNITYYDN